MPLSKTGAELLFEVSHYEGGSTLVTSNLPIYDEWTEVFGSERLTGVAGGSHTTFISKMRRQLFGLNQIRTAETRKNSKYHG